MSFLILSYLFDFVLVDAYLLILFLFPLSSIDLQQCLNLSEGFDMFLYYIFNTMLIMLLIFHIYWWKLICAMIYRQLKNRGKVGEDIRSGKQVSSYRVLWVCIIVLFWNQSSVGMCANDFFSYYLALNRFLVLFFLEHSIKCYFWVECFATPVSFGMPIASYPEFGGSDLRRKYTRYFLPVLDIIMCD